MHLRIAGHAPYLALTGQYGIGQQLARQADQVGLALGQDLLAVLGITQRVAR